MVRSPLRGGFPRPRSVSRGPLILALFGAAICSAGFLPDPLDGHPHAGRSASAATPPAAEGFDEEAARDLRLGKGLYDQGLFERALPPLERVRRGNPNAKQREEALFLLGEAHRTLDEWEKAEARFGELLRFAAGSDWAPLAKLGRGEALVRLDREQEAVPLLESATKTLAEAGDGTRDDRPVAHYWLAEANARLEQIEDALTGWTTIVETAPDHALAPYAAYNAALRWRDRDAPAKGLRLLDAVKSAELDRAMRDRLQLLTGELALRAGDPARSIAEYGRVEGEAALPAALAGAAWAAKESGDTDTLVALRRRLAEKFGASPERLEVDLLFGSLRAEAGDVAATDRALTRHEPGVRGGEATFWRAWARRVAGDAAGAGAMFFSIEGEGPWAARAVLRAEEEFRKAEDWARALEAARRFISHWRDDPRASTVVAGAVESSYRLGDDARVLDLDASFHAQWPDDPLAGDVRHYAAESALRNDDPARAVELFAQLWSQTDRRPAIAARYAWALLAADADRAAAPIAALLPALEGRTASEVGVLLGRAYAETGDRDRALAAYRRAAASDPRGESGTRARLEEAILLAGGDAGDAAAHRAAEEAYRAVLAGSASEVVRARARIDLAVLLAARGDDRAAQPEFSRYLADHEEGADRGEAWLGLAFSRLRTSDLDGALEAVAGLRRDDAEPTRRAEASYLEARIFVERGDTSAATRAYSAYLDSSDDTPRAAEVLRELARLAEESGDRTGAIAFLERRLTEHPRATATDEALYRLGWLRLAAGEEQGARETFTRLVSHHADSDFAGDAHFRLGEIAYAADDQAAARRAFTAAIERGTNAAAKEEGVRIAERARYRLGWSYRKSEEWQRSAELFEALATENPEGELAGEALYLAADASERDGRAADAHALLERFLAQYPEHERVVPVKIRVAEALAEQQDWARIRTLLDPLRTTRLDDPWLARHRIALGRALVRLGSGKRAVPILTEALVEGGARAAEAQYEIGLAYRQTGDRDRAIEAFIHGPVLYPFKPWAVRSHLEAGRDLLATGKPREATRLLKLALEQDPDGAIGREAKRMLEGADEKESF